MIFFCVNCNESFETPFYYNEGHGLDSPPYEKILCCPYCNSDDIIETIPCDICGEAISEDYIHIEAEDKNVCNNCYQEKIV